MTQSQPPLARWQVWVIPHGDYLRTAAGTVRLFADVEETKRRVQELGGIVQPERAPALGGFDRAFG
jgi:hypothetical protein